jgi:hypothetical protein
MNLILELKQVTKQQDVDLNSVLRHFKHNMKINILTPNNISDELKSEFMNVWNSFQPILLSTRFDPKYLLSKNVNTREDSARNIMEDSIPIL